MSIGHAWEPDMFEGPHALTTPIRYITDPSSYRREDPIMYALRDFDQLAELMNGQDFDHVWTVTLDRRVIDVEDIYAPDVSNDPVSDVDIMGEGEWHALTGMTGQYGYSGAVMHNSESFGRGMAMAIAHMCDEAYEQDRKLAWTVVEVRNEDGTYPEGDPIGWAVVWRYI